MLICNLTHKKFNYEFEKLTRLFLPFERIDVVNELKFSDRFAICSVKEENGKYLLFASVTIEGRTESFFEKAENERYSEDTERKLSVCLFKALNKLTGIRPCWGILTGVRPARLFGTTVNNLGLEKAKEYFKNELLVEKEKISLCEETYKVEENIISLSDKNDISLYISVPFCPSRCSYCSFVSHSVESAEKLIPDYVEHLIKELEITGEIAKRLNLNLKTVYMGGGTPTTLSANQLSDIFDCLNRNFDLKNLAEFSVEAGRPDTVTKEKLAAIKNAGATRISINPQTLNDDVLKNIGRKHTVKQFYDAYYLAVESGFDNINIDLIAGLPGDTFESFKNTVCGVTALSPASVTVHTLSVKRASNINTSGNLSDIKAENDVSKSVSFAREYLTQNGIKPYYMYRQSKTLGNLENVGFSKKGFEGLYNVYIMDETHSIFGVGASAVTKLRIKGNNDIKRIFNFKYPYEYIGRFDEQIKRKEEIVKFYEKNR